ncbi:TldD/PmbA family protein [Thermoplasmatales archaeon AK]|nr:TldD/PmbA family protein [Thermoplasmatales archaeon AK]
MPGENIEKILDYAGEHAEYADVRFMEIRSTNTSTRNGEFDSSTFGTESGYAVRVVNSSISFGYTDSEDWSEIKGVVDRAIQASRRPGKNKLYLGRAEKAEWKVDQRKPLLDMDIQDKISILMSADSAMEEAGATVRVNSISDKTINAEYKNTTGSHIRAKIARIFYFYLAGVVENGEFEQSTQEFGSSSGYEYIDSLGLQDRIRHDVQSLKESTAAPHVVPGRFDLIVGPEISGIVAHESCGHPTEYDRIAGREGAQAGESFLSGKTLPFRIGSQAVSVIDDPTFPGSFGFYRYDDEGIPARKRYLYKNGYTNEFILNRESASWIGTESNGGGRSSSWDMEPLARMSTTYVEPGDYRFEELFEGIKRGIYIKNFTEWNIDDIRMNEKYVGKEAYLIANGDIAGRVRRPVIETTTIKFYSAVDAVGRDLEFSAGMCGKGDPEQGVDVWMGGPHMRLRGVYIS